MVSAAPVADAAARCGWGREGDECPPPWTCVGPRLLPSLRSDRTHIHPPVLARRAPAATPPCPLWRPSCGDVATRRRPAGLLLIMCLFRSIRVAPARVCWAIHKRLCRYLYLPALDEYGSRGVYVRTPRHLHHRHLHLPRPPSSGLCLQLRSAAVAVYVCA